MPDQTRCLINVYVDVDLDGIKGPGDIGIPGWTYHIIDIDSLSDPEMLQEGVVGSNGEVDVIVDTPTTSTLRLTVLPKDNYYPTTDTTQDFILIIGPGLGEVELDVEVEPVECTEVVSSWLRKICYHPTKKVSATFRHSRLGSIRVYYPGTTYADYTAWKLAASKGQWANLFYMMRPYNVG